MTPNPYLFIVVFAGVAVVFPLLPLALACAGADFFNRQSQARRRTRPTNAASSRSARRKFNFTPNIISTRLFFDLRRGGDFSGAVRGCVHESAGRRVHRHSRLPTLLIEGLVWRGAKVV